MLEGKTALLVYEDVRKPDSPGETLLEFLESAYQAEDRRLGRGRAKGRAPESSEEP